MSDVASQQRIHGYCALCIARCGSIAVVEDGRFIRLDPDPDASDRPGTLRQGSRRAGARLPQGAADAPAPAHPSERRPRSWLGADLLGRGAGPVRRGDATDCRAAGAGGRRFSLSSPSTTAIGDSASFIRRLMNAFGTPNVGQQSGRMRLGTRRRDPLHLSASRSVATGGGGGDAGHRQYRLPDPVGLQPELHAPLARDRHGRGAEARHAADRGRSAACRARSTRRTSGCGCGQAPTALSPSASPI